MPNDLDRLEGTWNVTSLEVDGQDMSEGSIDGASIVIKGNTFISIGMGATYEGTVELDDTKNPKTFQLLFTVGHAAGTRNRGIYKLDGEKWTMCLATRGSRRPREFATQPGTGFALQTLEREGVGAGKQKKKKTTSTKTRATTGDSPTGTQTPEKAGPAIASSGAPTAWEGEWEMVAGVFNGVAMAQNMVNWCHRITRGIVTSIVAGPQLMLKATFALDYSKMPHAVDYVNLEGSNARKQQAGIFELKGGELRVCMSAPGQPRPGDFSSKPRDGRSYTEWRLVKK